MFHQERKIIDRSKEIKTDQRDHRKININQRYIVERSEMIETDQRVSTEI